MTPVPQPKQARSQRTREVLIETGARLLVKLGYQKASTIQIASEAGMSQGALFKHFPRKPQLIAAAIERILAGFVADFRAGIGRRPAPGAGLDERVAKAVTALWAIFRRPEMQAVFEVYVVARTDREIGAALAPVIDQHRLNILEVAVQVFPELAGVTDFAGVVDAVVYAMQGVALGVFGPESGDRVHLDFFQRLAARELETAIARSRKGASS